MRLIIYVTEFFFKDRVLSCTRNEGEHRVNYNTSDYPPRYYFFLYADRKIIIPENNIRKRITGIPRIKKNGILPTAYTARSKSPFRA